MFIRQLLQAVIVKARDRCSRLQHLICIICQVMTREKLIIAEDFFGKEANLTVSGQLQGET